MRRMLLVGTLLSVLMMVSSATATTHCSFNRACIERVARISCQTHGDPWHCRIYDRYRTHILRFFAHEAAVPRPATVKLAAPPGQSPLYTPFRLCVANREAGSPGATTYSTVQWAINTGNGYTGGYQFADETWQAVERMMGIDLGSKGWTAEAWIATPDQQTAAFAFYEAKNPYAWPNTVPACGGP